MDKFVCVNCGTFIVKSALNDPYTCRECEKLVEGAEKEQRYSYLDNLY